jgi:hypothetical protein
MISPLPDPSQSLLNASRELRRKMAHFIPSAGIRPNRSCNSIKGARRDAVAFYKSKAWTDMAPQRDKAYKVIRRYVVEVEK